MRAGKVVYPLPGLLLGALLVGVVQGLAMPGRCVAAELPRQADWQLRIAHDAGTNVLRIASVQADSPAARAGILASDRLKEVEAQPVTSPADIARARHRSKGGQPVRFTLERSGYPVRVTFTPRARPREAYPDLDVRYDSATTPGGAVSFIVTTPRGAGHLPTIVFIPWLSCDGIDYPTGPVDGWSRVLLEIAHGSGMTLVRVEKIGMGDSTGPACVDTELDADMAGYRAALREVARLPEVDASRIFLFGGSIGAALVPILAREIPVRGIVASGGFYKTWLEHMLEIERRRMGFEGATPAQVTAALRGYADFYSRYLNGGQTPAQVLAQRPDLEPLWYDEPDHQYGRTARYYQEVQQLDVAGAWSEVKVPVLVVHGEYDWIMSREDQDLVVATVNRNGPGLARLVVVPKMDHNLSLFDSPQRAYAEQGARPATSVAPEVIRFVKDVLARPAS
jgi:pimeloyl-ACP methyl ester carboxylesterase